MHDKNVTLLVVFKLGNGDDCGVTDTVEHVMCVSILSIIIAGVCLIV